MKFSSNNDDDSHLLHGTTLTIASATMATFSALLFTYVCWLYFAKLKGNADTFVKVSIVCL